MEVKKNIGAFGGEWLCGFFACIARSRFLPSGTRIVVTTLLIIDILRVPAGVTMGCTASQPVAPTPDPHRESLLNANILNICEYTGASCYVLHNDYEVDRASNCYSCLLSW